MILVWKSITSTESNKSFHFMQMSTFVMVMQFNKKNRFMYVPVSLSNINRMLTEVPRVNTITNFITHNAYKRWDTQKVPLLSLQKH